MRMTKDFAKVLATAALLALPCGAASAQVTLKAVMHSDLKIVDPIWTTAYITRNHGYMIYDTLFAMDEKGEIKPQMLEKYDESPDRKTYTFTLREGLLWHDGRRRPEDLHDQAQGPDRPPHLRPRQAVLGGAVHDAEAHRRDRSQHPDLGIHRLRPVRVQDRRVEAGRQNGLPQVRQVQAPRRAGLGPCRRQGREGRPRRVACDLRPPAGDERAHRRRDRLHGGAEARSPAPRQGRAEPLPRRLEPARQPVHLPPELAAQAVRQPEDPPGALVRVQPEGFPRRGHRRT